MSRSIIRRAGLALGLASLLAALLSVTLAGPAAFAAGTCTLSVSPASGPPGTQFVFTGSGYTPTKLTLTKDGAKPKVIDLNLGTQDPFTIKIVAANGDVGRWKAAAQVDGSGCVGTASIHVTLPSTATAPATGDTAGDRTAEMAAFAALALVFMAATALLYRRTDRRFGRAA